MPDCNDHCTRKYYVATYANKVISVSGLTLDGGAVPAADKVAVERDLQAKLQARYPLPPGLKAGPSSPSVVVAKQCPPAAGAFPGCRCIYPDKPPKYPKDYTYTDPNHPVTTTWKDGGGTAHVIEATISVQIAEEVGVCESSKPEDVMYRPGSEPIAVKRRKDA